MSFECDIVLELLARRYDLMKSWAREYSFRKLLARRYDLMKS